MFSRIFALVCILMAIVIPYNTAHFYLQKQEILATYFTGPWAIGGWILFVIWFVYPFVGQAIIDWHYRKA